MWMRMALSIVVSGTLLFGALCMLPDGRVARAEGPTASLDLDVLSSVVAIEADGAFVGTGVVVTRDGAVVTSHEIALMTLRGKKRLVVKSDLPRAATVIALDEKNDLALLQMHGIIPRPATLAAPGERANPNDIFVCRLPDGFVLQLSQKSFREGAEEAWCCIGDGGVCPVFGAKTGRLKAVLPSSVLADGKTAFKADVAKIRALIGAGTAP